MEKFSAELKLWYLEYSISLLPCYYIMLNNSISFYHANQYFSKKRR